jgi:hypothetical protein
MTRLTGSSTLGDASLVVIRGVFLLLNVKGLTHTDRDVEVQVNGRGDIPILEWPGAVPLITSWPFSSISVG